MDWKLEELHSSTVYQHLRYLIESQGVYLLVKKVDPQEEAELECFVVGAAEIGYSYSRRDVINLVEEVISRKGIGTNVSHGWWEGFKRRHPDVTLKKPEPLSLARRNGAHSTVLSNYFNELELV